MYNKQISFVRVNIHSLTKYFIILLYNFSLTKYTYT